MIKTCAFSMIRGGIQGLSKVVTSAVLTVLLFSLAHAEAPIVIATEESTRDNYLKLVSEYGNDPLKIKDIPPGKYHRTEVELAIIAKALRLGGMDNELKYLIIPNASREIEEVARGNAHLCSQPFSRRGLTRKRIVEDVEISSAIIRLGEFEKGIYHLPGNSRLNNVRSPSHLDRAGIGIIGMDWSDDKRALDQMGIVNYITAPTTLAVVRMLQAGRADWVPLLLSGKEDEKMVLGQRLVAVPGVKFSLLESRHFFVSKKRPMGKEVFQALQRGLEVLRKEGFIKRSLKAVGFFSSQAADWHVLNADDLKDLKSNDAW